MQCKCNGNAANTETGGESTAPPSTTPSASENGGNSSENVTAVPSVETAQRPLFNAAEAQATAPKTDAAPVVNKEAAPFVPPPSPAPVGLR